MEEKKGSVLRTSCTAWGLLYKTLVENELEIHEVAFEDRGKPFFKNGSVYFSVSHSCGLCAIAVSDQPIGVDVEIVKNHYNPRLIEHSLCMKEKNSFDGDFTRLWCRKEAVAKMTGKGIVGYPADIDTTNGYQFIENYITKPEGHYWIISCNLTEQKQST